MIQSEKMASLGELTAGIAHEIQNPLNFVNNFSEVSAELTQELKEELKAGNTADAIAIADDLEQNLGKIKHHGKRADSIVKGMLQHSQSGSGIKEPTNINALADEYLRLSFHGLLAKDKSFNSEIITDFDPELPKVNAIPQDIGRVMLNLFNNAFYAVNQKSKTAGADFKPEVSVTTSTESGRVTIKVKDNGIGMPDSIKDKIMQPFFTTKPTGEGTGLGLSLKPAIHQVRSMRKMQAFAPEIKKLQKKYANDKQRQAQEMQKLQKEHGVNPLGGCLPMLLQIPVFIGLNHVLRSFRVGTHQVYFFGAHDVQTYLKADLFGAHDISDMVVNRCFGDR